RGYGTTVLRAQVNAVTVGGAPLFAQAREQAQRALALVENGPADVALAAQVLRLQAELAGQPWQANHVADAEQSLHDCRAYPFGGPRWSGCRPPATPHATRP